MKKDRDDIFFNELTNSNRVMSQANKSFYTFRSKDDDSYGILELYMHEPKKNITLSQRVTTMDLLMEGIVIGDYEVVVKEEYYDLLRDMSLIKSPHAYMKSDGKELLVCSVTPTIQVMVQTQDDKALKANASGGAKGTYIRGKTFCMTGKLSRVRSEVIRMIEDNGGHVVSKVTGATDYLILGDKGIGTTKHTAALRYHTEIITEDDLMSSM